MVEVYAGLDVSDELTHVCVVNGQGAVVWAGACATDPEVVARTLKSRAPGLVRVVLETGPLSEFLYHGMVEREVPVVCICARHAKGVLSARTNKTDPHDAEGLAQMARTTWFKGLRWRVQQPGLSAGPSRVGASRSNYATLEGDIGAVESVGASIQAGRSSASAATGLGKLGVGAGAWLGGGAGTMGSYASPQFFCK